MNDGRVVCGSGHGISIYDYNNGWRNILEYKQPETLAILNNYDYNSFIADTIPYDFGEYISDLEEGPDGLLYCAIRGSRVYSSNPPRWSGGVIIIDIDNLKYAEKLLNNINTLKPYCDPKYVDDIVGHKLWPLYINFLIWKLKKNQYLPSKSIVKKEDNFNFF